MKDEIAKHHDIKKKTTRGSKIIAAVIILILITSVLVNIYFAQKDRPDPASEALFRQYAAPGAWS